jgi:hypothetical protein
MNEKEKHDRTQEWRHRAKMKGGMRKGVPALKEGISGSRRGKATTICGCHMRKASHGLGLDCG